TVGRSHIGLLCRKSIHGISACYHCNEYYNNSNTQANPYRKVRDVHMYKIDASWPRLKEPRSRRLSPPINERTPYQWRKEVTKVSNHDDLKKLLRDKPSSASSDIDNFGQQMKFKRSSLSSTSGQHQESHSRSKSWCGSSALTTDYDVSSEFDMTEAMLIATTARLREARADVIAEEQLGVLPYLLRLSSGIDLESTSCCAMMPYRLLTAVFTLSHLSFETS
ncbi:MAG: hypothetical protein ACREBR_02525, partial [bacterium]